MWCLYKDRVLGIWVTRTDLVDEVLVGTVWGCSGDFKEFKAESIECFGAIENWFRFKGCKFVEWVGREGWQRIFPEYEKHAVILRKRL